MATRKKQKITAAGSSADGAASSADRLPIDLETQSPKEVAAALLSHLAPGATDVHEHAKKLQKAFALVGAELKSRAAALARANESAGASLPVVVCGGAVSLPTDCFSHILTRITCRELVRVSRVAKCWLSGARDPVLWPRLDWTVLSPYSPLPMKGLVAVLARSQFSGLRSLTLPNNVKLGKTGAAQLSRCCPLLEELDAGFVAPSFHVQGREARRARKGVGGKSR